MFLQMAFPTQKVVGAFEKPLAGVQMITNKLLEQLTRS